MNGKLITFEGLDGSGKTTVIKQVIKTLNEKIGSQSIIYTREPGGNKIAEQIRNVIFSKNADSMDGRTEALLFAAARRQHLVDNIFPALKEGKIILCDRFVDSSIAYQGEGKEIGANLIERINQFATDGLKPDLTFYFDITPEEGLERIKTQRKHETNRLDKEQLDFYYKVEKGYRKLIQKEPGRFVELDASKSVNEIVEDVISVLLMQIFDKKNE